MEVPLALASVLLLRLVRSKAMLPDSWKESVAKRLQMKCLSMNINVFWTGFHCGRRPLHHHSTYIGSFRLLLQLRFVCDSSEWRAENGEC